MRRGKACLLTYSLTSSVGENPQKSLKLQNLHSRKCTSPFPTAAFCWTCFRPVLMQTRAGHAFPWCRFQSSKEFWGFLSAEEVRKVSKQVFTVSLGIREGITTYLLTYLLCRSKAPKNFKTLRHAFMGMHFSPAAAFCWRCFHHVLLQMKNL